MSRIPVCAAFQTWICCNRSFPVLVTSATFSSLHELDVGPLEMLETQHSSFVCAHEIRNITVQDSNFYSRQFELGLCKIKFDFCTVKYLPP